MAVLHIGDAKIRNFNASTGRVVCSERESGLNVGVAFERNNLPMLRNVADPFDVGGFEFSAGVEASGDGAVDEDGFLLVEEFDLALLFGNQSVNLRRFLIEEGDDAVDLVIWRQGCVARLEMLVAEAIHVVAQPV